MPVKRSWGVLVEPGRLDACRLVLLPVMARNVLSRYVTRSRHPLPHVDHGGDYPVGLVPSHNPAHAHYDTSTREGADDMGRGP